MCVNSWFIFAITNGADGLSPLAVIIARAAWSPQFEFIVAPGAVFPMYASLSGD